MIQSSFVFRQLNGFKYRKWLNNSIWLVDETLTGTTTLGQSASVSNGNEEVLYIPKVQGLKPYHQIEFCVISGHSLLVGELYPFYRDSVCIFYCFSRLDLWIEFVVGWIGGQLQVVSCQLNWWSVELVVNSKWIELMVIWL